MPDFELPPHIADALERYGFDAAAFFSLRAELRAGAFPPERNRLTAAVTLPPQGAITAWPQRDNYDAWKRLGDEAIAAGHVASVVLNGGMATRFGGQVKGIVEVFPGQSFLALKLAPYASVSVPVFLMNSFATDAATRAHMADCKIPNAHMVTQRISLRLTPDGELFRDREGMPSPYAPGHGDLFDALAGSPAFAAFIAGGGRYVLVSNVDNLGASLSPVVIGAHIALGQRVTVEVVDRDAGDSGGAPALVDGRLMVVEGFRFPRHFDVQTLPVFNTNTLVLNAAVAHHGYPLTWFRVDKTVDDEPVVQFERLFGEVTAFESTAFLHVPRSGSEGRFLPVKTPEDLVALRHEFARRDFATSPT